MTEPTEAQLAETPLHCYRHPDRPTYVSCVRCGRPICPEDMHPAAVGFHCPEEIKDARSTVRQPRTVLGGRVHAGRDATTVLIGINVVVFLITTASGTGFFSGSPSLLFARFADLPGRLAVAHGGTVTVLGGVANGEYYRLLTSMFLHFGILHLATNMYVLYIVGPALERALGRARFVSLYFIAGLGGSIASAIFGPPTELAAGASGAIFGLFGAYYVVGRRLGVDTRSIVGIIVLNLFISFAVPNIDIRAHLGGLVIGAVLGAVFAYAPAPRRTAIHVAGGVVVLAVLVVAIAVRASVLRHDEVHQLPAQEQIGLGAPPQLPAAPTRLPSPLAAKPHGSSPPAARSS